MKPLRTCSISLYAVSVLFALFPGMAMARSLEAYELVWLVPFIPAWIGIFVWLVIVMTGHFIKADSYKNPAAIESARRFLIVFEAAFTVLSVLFIITEFLLLRHFAA